MSPTPTITVRVGGELVVTVPGWHWGDATDVNVGNPGVLSEQCSVLLPDHGRRAVLLAVSLGESHLSATVTPASDVMMPAWSGEVVVTANS